ncbi:MAG: ATP-binding protein [Methyloligellaceae bacterium]
MSRALESISGRLIVSILLFSSVITLMATSLQLYFDYARDVSSIHERMEQIRKSYLNSITGDLWAMDREQLKVHLVGIKSLPDMLFLQISMGGEPFMSVGEDSQQRVISNTFPIDYKYNDRVIKLGELRAVASLQNVHQRLIDKALVILGSQAIKTFLVSTFIFLLFHYLITRHLLKMSAYARGLNIDTLDRALELDRPTNLDRGSDELDHVVHAFNDMRQNLQNSWQELDSEHRRRLNAERLAGIGELSASIAHEIRNPLSSIINAVELLGRRQISAKNRAEAITLANAESQRLQHILNEFLQFARQRPPVSTCEDIVEVIADVAESLRLGLDPDVSVRIKTSFHEDPCYVRCDREQIRQVLWNLMLNAVQAMPDGGTLSLSTEARDDRTCIAIGDTGSGIPETMRAEVIKPFVTNRADGTGLGLSVTQKILMEHDSELSISSVEGQGTEACFHLANGRPQ